MGRLGPPAVRAALSYVAVEAAGARAVVLPPRPWASDEAVARLDAVVFAGGADLDPALYGDEPHPATQGVRTDRDAGELPLLQAALRADLPVLGICRGMQLLRRRPRRHARAAPARGGRP